MHHVNASLSTLWGSSLQSAAGGSTTWLRQKNCVCGRTRCDSGPPQSKQIASASRWSASQRSLNASGMQRGSRTAARLNSNATLDAHEVVLRGKRQMKALIVAAVLVLIS